MRWGVIKEERQTSAHRSNKGSRGIFGVVSVCRRPCKASLARGHRVPAEDKLVLRADVMWFCILQCRAVMFQSHNTRCAAPADPCSSRLHSGTHFLCFLFVWVCAQIVLHQQYPFICLRLCSCPTNVFSASLYSEPCVYRAGYAF